MKSFTALTPYKPSQWEKNPDWMFNRSLYLLTMTSLDIIRFKRGGFEQEDHEFQEKQPEIFQQALWQYMDDIVAPTPTYRVLKEE